MLWHYRAYCLSSFILLSLILWASAGYVYRGNKKRAADDPKKKYYHPGAIFLVPVIWPFFFFASTLLFIIKALLYGVFLILFAIALVAIRKPFLLVWLERIASYIGNKLLEANTLLIRIVLGDWDSSPHSA